MHNINFILFYVPKAREEWIKFWFCWCFSTNRAHALDLYPILWVGHASSKVWESQLILQVFQTYQLKTKIGLAEEGDITIRGVITRIFVFKANQGTRLINFTRRSPVRRTYNTEPSPKELAWGRSALVYPGKYAFPLF